MPIKKSYEISIWSEILGENGQKIEHKDYIIGSDEMTYQGRATSIKFEKKLNGTHTLTFSLPDRFYDGKQGTYVKNEFVDQLFNERKVKFRLGEDWFEFYIKEISDSKNFKSFMKTYTCQDAFIDELSRNGYGLTFSEELYNNVEEVGTFTEEILEDSVWKYSPQNNWGDFTEFLEEKLFKIPVSQFEKLEGFKLTYQCAGEQFIQNPFTGEERQIEMGDDLARGIYYWDQEDGANPLLSQEAVEIENDGFIYVPISQLSFCYETTSNEGEAVLTATEEIVSIPEHSYALAPSTIDPSALIQFIAIPKDKVIEIDEAGLIVNKDCSYVMTVEQWNENLKHNQWFYEFEPLNQFDNEKGIKRVIKSFKLGEGSPATGNYCAYYDGYLNQIGDQEVLYGKKISISDRTEINPTKEIDQFVKVYNKKSNDVIEGEVRYADLLESEEKWDGSKDDLGYRICSKQATRQIVPQLARNLIQNGVNIKSVDGWEIANLNVDIGQESAKVEFVREENSGSLKLTKSTTDIDRNNMLINFGICAQEVELSNEKIYCFGWQGQLNMSDVLVIGNGKIQGSGEYEIEEDGKLQIPFSELFADGKTFTFLKLGKQIANPYIAIILNGETEQRIDEMWFFECFTRGIDQFPTGFFKYSGRQLFEQSLPNGLFAPYSKEECQNLVLFEDSIMPGDTYGYLEYYIQQVQARPAGELLVNDTFLAKEFITPDGNLSSNDLPYSSQLVTNDDLSFVTRKFNMNKCPYYKDTQLNEFDCGFGCAEGQYNKVCMYQKYGYCPYLFQTEKHCRKVRTLKQDKSNRFNLTQELSKVFEIYPIYYTKFSSQGKILTDENGTMDKRIFYITEKGNENKLGFRYEKNLSNISRSLKSDQIITKLYVEDVDSQVSDSGLCTIKTAEDNVSKDNFIINLSYYVSKGMLDQEQLERDLYGKEQGDLAYLKQLGYYNEQYDHISNLIINLSSESFAELQSNVQVNLEAIETAQQQLLKLKKQLNRYGFNEQSERTEDLSASIKNTFTKYDEQYAILEELFDETFCTNGSAQNGLSLETISIEEFENSDAYKLHTYEAGMIGQFNREYQQIQEWKRQQGSLLKKINELSLRFYRKYEPYLKEGTWTDSNYLTANAYYFGAQEVAADGAIPKVSYTITTVDIEDLPNQEDYHFDIADTTYVEDVGMFGFNQKTGLPNRLKVLISGITYDPDQPMSNTITVQNFTTQFEDLFQQVSSSVQSLTFNENIYKRSSNFTSNQNIKEESLQGTLDSNNLTLINTQENNISLDAQGQAGSDINNHNNKYKLNGQGLLFSNNGGQSWNVGVGPSGINADYIKVGNLDVGKIKIVDGDYLYFYWDKDGIIALREPTETTQTSFSDFTVFNRTGLSLVENNRVRLRAGYDMNKEGSVSGEFNPNEKASGNIGFYLYNNQGQKIFATRTVGEQGEDQLEDLSARLDLTGEICANGMKINEIVTIEYSEAFELESVTCDAYIYEVKNLEEVKLNNGSETTLKAVLDQYFGSDNSAGGNESADYKYGESDNQTSITFSKSTVEKCLRGDIYCTNQTTVQVSGFTNGAEAYNGTYIKNNEYYFAKSSSQATINLMKEKTDSQPKVTEQRLETEQITYYEKEGQSKATGVFPKETIDNQTTYYKHSKITSQRTEQDQNSGGIGVYLNNTYIGTPQDNQLQRIFSCVKFDNSVTDGNVKNLFTILTNGSVYLGGEIKTKSGIKQRIDNFDYNIDSIIGQNILKLDADGGIYFGETNIVDSLQQQINEIAAKGLIQHRHRVFASWGNGLGFNGLVSQPTFAVTDDKVTIPPEQILGNVILDVESDYAGEA